MGMYSGDEDNSDDVTSGPAPEPECEHTEETGPGIHWGEDVYGNEYRIDCGCPCAACREY